MRPRAARSCTGPRRRADVNRIVLRARARVRRAQGRQVEVDGERGVRAQRRARSRRHRSRRDRPRRIHPAARERAAVAHRRAGRAQDARRGVRSVRRRSTARPRKTDIAELTREAREMLRPHFLSADMGITGANFVVAETGSTLIVTNEGNGRMVTTLPRVHVAITGIEKVVPTLEDVATLLRLLPRARHRADDHQLRLDHDRPARGRRPRRPRAIPRRSSSTAGAAKLLGGEHAGDAALHPLRRVHEPLPGVPERRRPRLRLGLSRARWARC